MAAAAITLQPWLPKDSPQEAIEHVTENEMLRQQRSSERERGPGEEIHAVRLLIRDAQLSWRGQAGAEIKTPLSFDRPGPPSQRPLSPRVYITSELQGRRQKLIQLGSFCTTEPLVH